MLKNITLAGAPIRTKFSNMELFVIEIRESALTAFERLAHDDYSILIDSADKTHPHSNYTYALFNPTKTIKSNKWNDLHELHETFQTSLPDYAPVPFCGGIAGLISYDGEIQVGLYTQLIATDHQANEHFFLYWGETIEEAQDALIALLSRPPCETQFNGVELNWQSNFTRERFESAVEKVRQFIAAGDIFQANIAQRFSAKTPSNFDSFAHYLNLRRINPAPYAAYMNGGNFTLTSASPERFLSCSANGEIITQPIKGTMPRFDDPEKDSASARALETSEKDRAENIMIVDLLRNDISAACEDNSVTVDALCELQSFARVHHLVSTIKGQLRENKNAIDLLEGAFPGGSITGAPKIRTMEIIQEIEQIQRGAYCGSMITIGFDGATESNILIRTLIHQNNELSFQAGGGITYASDPAAEYEETLDKAAAIFDSFKTQTKEQAA